MKIDNIKIASWVNANDEMPDHSGEYVIKVSEDKEYKPALYLKAGETIRLKAYIEYNKPENIILFSLNKPVILAEAEKDGFYQIKTNKKGEETLKYVNIKDLFWAATPKKRLEYNKRHVFSEKNVKNNDSEKSLKDVFKSKPGVKDIYVQYIRTFKNDVFDFCGTKYNVDKDIIDKSFIKALKYRDMIIALRDYPDINTLTRIAFLPDASEEYPVNKSLEIRENLCDYLRALNEKEKDIETISDAYFVNMFLPTKADVIKVLFQDELKLEKLSKEIRIVRVFQRYQIIDALRQLMLLYSPDNKGNAFRDGMIDTIATIQLAQALAINHFGIKEFKDVFREEMGI